MAYIGILVAILIIVFAYFFTHQGSFTPAEQPKVIQKSAQDAVNADLDKFKKEQEQVNNIDLK